jgi:DNA-binding CsgD family transcriptional regulator
MKLLSSVIDVTDFVTLVVVWELQPESQWQLFAITRLRNAIALVRESPLTRLVFPTEIKPNRVWGGIYKNRSTKTNPKKVNSLQKRQERVLALFKNSPGQTRDALAEQLGVSVATVGQLLRKLEKSGDIYHCPHPSQNKTKLYYTGATPATTGITVTSSRIRAVPDARREQPLRVYFVDPQTLQGSK